MIVGCLPCLAGSGATSLALAAGALLAERGHRVTLADADPSAELSQLLGVTPARPLHDLLSWTGGPAPRPVPVSERLSVIPMQRGRFLAGGAAPPRSALRAALDPWRTEGLLFVDLAPVGNYLTLELLPLLDELLLALPARGSGLRAAPAALRLLLDVHPSERPRLGAIAVTQARPGDPSHPIPQALHQLFSSNHLVLEIPWISQIEASSLAPAPPPSRLLAAGLGPWLDRFPRPSQPRPSLSAP